VAFRTAIALLLALTVSTVSAAAGRPIVDLHRLDAYFALFAADSNVPWKTTTVRLDTYSSAPVHFAVYRVDPADVLTAGSNARPRAVVTRGLSAASSFDFTPPGGYQFQSNEVDVRLGSREGFFVVEASRGDVGEQVWINRSRVGLISKETSGELVVYGADLGTGRALGRMRVQFVVDRRFATLLTDDRGIVRWTRSPRPVFALAQWGDSYAFLSLLPQPPLPATIVGIRTDSAVVRAGGAVRVVGFARSRAGAVLRAAGGSATVSLRNGAASIGERRVTLDAAGAFDASFALPLDAPAGEYAVLARVGGGVGGATVHVDASAGGLSLAVSAPCAPACDAAADVPLTIRASRPGTTVHVMVVRSPHVYAGYIPEVTPWATTVWLDRSLRIGSDGVATLTIPHPSDELGSTYGVRVESGGATADTRVVVPTSRAAIRVKVDREDQNLGTPIGFDVYAQELDTGRPLAGATVTARLVHGASIAQQQLVLDADGHARGSFGSAQLGTNLVFASVDDSGRATDAQAVQVEARASDAAAVDRSSADVRVTLDRPAYRANDDVSVAASAPGARGDALITLENALGTTAAVVPVNAGRAAAHFRATDSAGDLRVGSAFVGDGAMEWTTVPLNLDAPGRPQFASLSLDRDAQFAPGAAANVSLRGAPPGGATMVVRISRGEPSGSAVFDSAPDLLAVGATVTQNSAPAAVTWHPWVDSTGSHAAVLGFVRRTQPPADVALAQADTDAVSWSVARANGNGFAVNMPVQSGRYTISVLDISDDGSVSAGSSNIVVR
jgi:hypothetical protein